MVDRRRVAVIGTGLAGLAAVSAFTGFKIIPRTNLMHASWAVKYSSIAQLKADATLVVAGHFTGVATQGAAPASGIPFTEFTFAVDKGLYDPGSRVKSLGGVLLIHQTGSVSGNVTTEFDDDPLFVAGQSAVLFLREYEPGHFAVVGGPQGRYTLSSSGSVAIFNVESVPFAGTENALTTVLGIS